MAAERGHAVTLYEKKGSVGGLLEFANNVKGPHENLSVLRNYFERQMELLGVNVVLNTEATADTIAEAAPDAVILATGGVRDRLGLDETAGTNVVGIDDFMMADIAEEVVVVGSNAQAIDAAMYLLAQDRGVSLDDSENKRAGQAAEEYFGSLTEQEKELMGVKAATIEQLYREYALADKIYRYIIQDVNPEISDDEARTITVQHILVKTGDGDGTGSQTADADALRQAAYEKALEIRRMAAEDGEDFLDLASRYSEDSVITYSFGKGEMEAAFEEAAFSLETGEVSQVVETEAGYHIIKCISTFDREQTDLNKLTIVEERRREVFGQEYDAFVETLVRQLNQELWENLKLLHDEAVTTTGFFDTYAKYFPD